MHFTVLQDEMSLSLYPLCHKQFLALFSRAVPKSFRLKCPPPHWWGMFSYAVISVTVAALQQYCTGKCIFCIFRMDKPAQELFTKHRGREDFFFDWPRRTTKARQPKTATKDEKKTTTSLGQQHSFQPRMYPHENQHSTNTILWPFWLWWRYAQQSFYIAF